MQVKKINIQSELDKIKSHWALSDLGSVNNHVVRIAKLKGDFEMHKHDNGEKLFYVMEGTLCLEFIDGEVMEVYAGEFVIIPQSTEHKPFAPEEACVMLFEPI